ncbi:hypothetical protein GCM10010207_61890 [Streptomyces atratus]|nr:hypothetical protein GCM10010207_61890 [Streptomyces atratus]
MTQSSRLLRPFLPVLLLGLTSCGTGPAIDASKPMGAGEPATGIVAGTAVYFLKDGALHPVERSAAGITSPTEAVRALLTGPSPEDRKQGLTSALPPLTGTLETALAKVTATPNAPGRLRVTLPYDPTTLTPLALGQLTCTASATALVELTGTGHTTPATHCSDYAVRHPVSSPESP